MSSHQSYFATKVLFVKLKGFFAMSWVVDINVKFYGLIGVHDSVLFRLFVTVKFFVKIILSSPNLRDGLGQIESALRQ